jgi:hypothetical protein
MSANYSQFLRRRRKVHGQKASYLSLHPNYGTLTDIYIAADLRKWGYEMHNAPNDYCNYAPGGWWGVGPTLETMDITQTVGKADGEWRALEISHQDVESMIDLDEQTYVDPHGKSRRVS